MVDFLLDTLEDVKIDAADVEGQTAMYHAAMGGHYQIVRRLIEAGATIDKRNKVCQYLPTFNVSNSIDVFA